MLTATQLKPADLLVFLVACIKAGLNVLIQGAPGLGKTDLTHEATRQASASMIQSHPVVEDPSVPAGLPFIVNGQADFLPFGNARKAYESTGRTVWFLDDLGQATPATQAAYMQLLLARELNGKRLPDGVTFIAATNRRTDKAGVSGILEPVKSRFASIVELVPDLDAWCNWLIDHDYPATLVAYHRFKGGNSLCNFVASADMTNSPTPRTWSHVGKLQALNLPAHIQHAAFAGAVGEGEATEYSGFLRMFNELPNVDLAILDPLKVKLPKGPGTMYAFCGAMANRATTGNFPQIATFANRLINEAMGEYAVLLIRDAWRKDASLATTTAGVKLITGDWGKLAGGMSAKSS